MTENSGQIILEETSDEDFIPTADELEACAKMLGIDLEKEPYLTKLVHECLTASLPEAWKACVDQQGNLYYFNFSTGDSSWEHPCDALYRRLAMEERRRLSSESGDPNGLATNPSEAGSSSEKETVTETSLHAYPQVRFPRGTFTLASGTTLSGRSTGGHCAKETTEVASRKEGVAAAGCFD
ncbi:unnamed protein product [Dibothriocephalus latus]|uniref:WW domain-containing protein n=1 Tax=Dibothriocephalus latus TaxID=60516 RepID=A0A3P7MIS4_DIBLA|nr:unnamed protein product [Dibothriocephalus latus]